MRSRLSTLNAMSFTPSPCFVRCKHISATMQYTWQYTLFSCFILFFVLANQTISVILTLWTVRLQWGTEDKQDLKYSLIDYN